jgi:hypothetical protein
VDQVSPVLLSTMFFAPLTAPTVRLLRVIVLEALCSRLSHRTAVAKGWHLGVANSLVFAPDVIICLDMYFERQLKSDGACLGASIFDLSISVHDFGDMTLTEAYAIDRIVDGRASW